MAQARRKNWDGGSMSGMERAERFVRFGSVLTVVVLLWLMQGGEGLVATPTPASGFLLHLLFFFFLSGACLLGWTRNPLAICSGLLLLALIAEGGQMLFPSREFSYYDMAGNVAGVIVGWIFFITLRRFSRTIGL